MQNASIRYGGLCAVLGGVLSAVSLIAAPTFNGDLERQLRGIAGSDAWVVTDMVGLVGVLLVVIGALAVVAAIAGRSAGEPFARAARPLALMGGAIAVIEIGVNMAAYRQMAQSAAVAAIEDRQAAIYAAFAVGTVDDALTDVWSLILLGLVPILLGIAILRSRVYPMWLAVLALVGGLVKTALSIAGLLLIDLTALRVVDIIGSLLVVAVIVVTGGLLWLRPNRYTESAAARATGRD